MLLSKLTQYDKEFEASYRSNLGFTLTRNFDSNVGYPTDDSFGPYVENIANDVLSLWIEARGGAK